MSQNKQSHQILRDIVSIDLDILELWIQSNAQLTDSEYELFVEMMDSRLALLQLCLKKGLQIDKERCVPAWLEQMASEKPDLTMFNLKREYEILKKQAILFIDDSYQEGPGSQRTH